MRFLLVYSATEKAPPRLDDREAFRQKRVKGTFSLVYAVPDTDQHSLLSFGMLVEFISERYGSIRFSLGQAAIHDRRPDSAYSVLLAYHFGALPECCPVLNTLILWSEGEASEMSNVWSMVLSGSTEFDKLV
jgi:hypothetical protein